MAAVNEKRLAALLRSADSCSVGEGERVEKLIREYLLDSQYYQRRFFLLLSGRQISFWTIKMLSMFSR
jgi:hypothetical protein